VDWLHQILDGSPDAATIEYLRRGFDLWLKSATRGRRDANGRLIRSKPVSLGRCLGLPDNPEQVRKHLRDGHLRAAARCLDTDPNRPWQTATALHREVRRFAGHQWSCWLSRGYAPDNCTELDRQLFAAMRWGGGVLPTTPRQYANILTQGQYAQPGTLV
jgi:hypothetical protein